MFKKIITAMAISLLAACANGPIKPDLSQELQTSNIAVVYFMAKKNIRYSENVYKVFWTQKETQNASFEPFWDIDRDMSKRLATLLASQGLMATAIQDVLRSAPEYADFRKSMRSDEWSAEHPRSPLVLNEQTIAALTKANIRYVILDEYDEFLIEVNAITGTMGQTLGVLAIYDVNEKKEIYKEVHFLRGAIEVGKSPKEIEANGLAKLKWTAYGWLEKSKPFYADRLQIGGS